LSVIFSKGELLAIIGPVGSGKVGSVCDKNLNAGCYKTFTTKEIKTSPKKLASIS